MLTNRRRAHTDQMPRAMLLSAAIAAAFAEPGRRALYADGDPAGAAGAPAASSSAAPAAGASAAAAESGTAAASGDGKPAAEAGSTASSSTTIEQPGNLVGDVPAVSADDQKKFLIEKGAKAEDLDKLDAAALQKQYDDAKAAPAEPTAADARKFLVEKGMKQEDADKLSDADAVKQMKDAQAKPGDQKIEIKIPDGIKIDDKAQADFVAILSDDKLTPSERAQKLVDMHVAALKQSAEATYKQWVDTQKDWQSKVQADPEMGGENFAKVTKPAIETAIKHFAKTPEEETELRGVFNFTGAGNHPAMVRFMSRLGKLIGEGTMVQGGKPAATGQKSPAEKLYPSQAKSS